MPAALLADRAIVSVEGPDTRAFLNNLVTCDLEALGAGSAAFGALLTPQGKILFDFIVVGVDDEHVLLDTALEHAPALAKRLGMYKLRAKIAINATSQAVVAVWDDTPAPAGLAYRDPRSSTLGQRVIVDAVAEDGGSSAYEAHRIALGIPKGGIDFAWGDSFPHETNMDLLGGVSFTKGCYVGQEVVSRMHHRGTARRRIARVTFEAAAPDAGAEIRAGDALLGTFGSSAGGLALAAVRLDRLQDALDAGQMPMAAGVPLHIAAPE